jgi:hypothetical protein
MTRRYRPRKLFKFWLYHDLAEDTRLMEYIAYLRQTRQFAKILRNGLRLMWTLGEGDLSVLFELFPSLRSQFMPKGDELIEQFRQMLLQHQPAIPEFPEKELPAAGSAKALPAPQIAMPTFDDEDTMVIRRDTHADTDATANFLSAALGIQKNESDV